MDRSGVGRGGCSGWRGSGTEAAIELGGPARVESGAEGGGESPGTGHPASLGAGGPVGGLEGIPRGDVGTLAEKAGETLLRDSLPGLRGGEEKTTGLDRIGGDPDSVFEEEGEIDLSVGRALRRRPGEPPGRFGRIGGDPVAVDEAESVGVLGGGMAERGGDADPGGRGDGILWQDLSFLIKGGEAEAGPAITESGRLAKESGALGGINAPETSLEGVVGEADAGRPVATLEGFFQPLRGPGPVRRPLDIPLVKDPEFMGGLGAAGLGGGPGLALGLDRIVRLAVRIPVEAVQGEMASGGPGLDPAPQILDGESDVAGHPPPSESELAEEPVGLLCPGHLAGAAQELDGARQIAGLPELPLEQDHGEGLRRGDRRSLDRFFEKGHAVRAEILLAGAENDHAEEAGGLHVARGLDFGGEGGIDPCRHRGEEPVGEPLGRLFVALVGLEREGAEQRRRIGFLGGSRGGENEYQDGGGPGEDAAFKAAEGTPETANAEIHEFEAPPPVARIFSMVARRTGPMPVQRRPAFKAAASAFEPVRSRARA